MSGRARGVPCCPGRKFDIKDVLGTQAQSSANFNWKKYLLGLVPQPNPRGNTCVFGTSSPLTTGNNFTCKNLVGSQNQSDT